MITERGNSYFLNRLVNNNVPPIDNIVLGNGKRTPTKSDTSLTNEVLSKKPMTKIDLRTKRLILAINLSASEVEGITEIGAESNGELLTHDLITNIPNNLTSNINLDYIIELENTTKGTDWVLLEDNVYYTHETDDVIGVTEVNTGNGYHKATSIESMDNGSYYYDAGKELLHIITSDRGSPNTKDIQVITK